jgi:hypothetical protein
VNRQRFDPIAWVQAQLNDARKLMETTEKRLKDRRTHLTEEGPKWTVSAVEEILPRLRRAT